MKKNDALSRFEERGKRPKKVFLGGTCNNSEWREALIPLLEIDYFNPVVPDWTPECMAEEQKQRKECDICLYVITPMMLGSYAIAEVVDDSHIRPERTVFVVLDREGKMAFSAAQLSSLYEVGAMIVRNGGFFFKGLPSTAKFLNVYDPELETKKKPPIGSPRIADMGIDSILVSGMNTIKLQPITRQSALAITKLEEALHWLGYQVQTPPAEAKPTPEKEIKKDEKDTP